VVITGTGTGVGKTHLAVGLLGALRHKGSVVAGFKPIETGLVVGASSDADRLARASSFHVKQPLFAYEEAVSPHLAARIEGRPINRELVRGTVFALRAEAHAVVVEFGLGSGT
jgi:dethiobiotin synthetase